MPLTIASVFILLAIIFFALSAANIAARINLQSVGLAMLAIALFITGWK